MSQQISLKEAEDKVFRSVYNDGLWDVLLGCFMLIFALAPLLSTRLGDFWSSAVFLPFWALVALAIWLIRRQVVAPRLGVVKLGQAHKAKLARFNVVMLIVNSVALGLGVVVALRSGASGQTVSIVLGLILLAGFSVTAFLLGFGRLYLYGLLVGLSPVVGEWLYGNYGVPHHGFPITFGITAGIIALTGLVVFARLLRENPLPDQHPPVQDA
jgi:hypothetical protein